MQPRLFILYLIVRPPRRIEISQCSDGMNSYSDSHESNKYRHSQREIWRYVSMLVVQAMASALLSDLPPSAEVEPTECQERRCF